MTPCGRNVPRAAHSVAGCLGQPTAIVQKSSEGGLWQLHDCWFCSDTGPVAGCHADASESISALKDLAMLAHVFADPSLLQCIEHRGGLKFNPKPANPESETPKPLALLHRHYLNPKGR